MAFSRPSNEEILAAAQETEAERDARLSSLFNKFDTKRTGKLYREQIEAGLRKLHVPSEHKFAQELLLACDENHDGHCDLGEFKRHMYSKERELYSLFHKIDANFDGSLTLEELKASLESAGIPTDSSHLQHLLQRMDADGNGSISFAEWRDTLLLFPHKATLQDLFRYWEKVCQVDIGEHAVIPEGIPSGAHHEAWRYLAAGAVAGAVSRTATAPLDRIRVVLQCQSVFKPKTVLQCQSVFKPEAVGSLAQGAKGSTTPALPAGSSAINTQPHAPTPAVSRNGAKARPASPQPGFAAPKGGQQWALNGAYVGALSGSQGHLAAHSTETAGGSTRILAAAATPSLPSVPRLGKDGKPSHPPQLGLARTHSLGKLIAPWGALRQAVQQVLREGGVGAFFKGNGLNVLKIGPESAIKFFLYERLKETLAQGQGAREGPSTQSPSALVKFVSGGMAGALAQAAIYPLDMLKTRIQTYKMSHGSAAPPASALFASILRTEGPLAFYRGLGPTVVGVFPYAGIDLTLYETLKGSATAFMAQRSSGQGDVELNRAVQLLCGTVSGAVGAAAVYPLQVVRTRLQAIPTEAAKTSEGGLHFHSEAACARSSGRLTALGVASQIWRTEGIRGFYVGLLPGLLKVAPAATITYGVYEHMKQLLHLE